MNRYLSAAIGAALLSCAGYAFASGGEGFSENIFTPESGVPVAELPAYATGNLGLTPSSYGLVYQFMTYRALSGHPVSREEMDTLGIEGVGAAGPGNATLSAQYDSDEHAISTWQAARQKVTSVAAAEINTSTQVGQSIYFTNCYVDAFARAVDTLNQRLAQGGKQWTAVWLANQDAVFANCGPKLEPGFGGGKVQDRPLFMPLALPSKAPDWLVKDYAYQSASALFYAGRYDQARQRYLDIAKDAKSPWQPFGAYLAARCLLRKASLAAEDVGYNKPLSADAQKLFTTARSEFQSISATYAPANSMVSWVDFRLRPEARRVELSAVLATQKLSSATAQQFTDYSFLVANMNRDDLLAAKDPMTSWIGIMQIGYRTGQYGDKDNDIARKKAVEIARAYWKKDHQVQWLVAILENSRAGELTPAEMKAANEVAADAPAYGLLQYHLARLLITEGKVGDADTLISAMLKRSLQTSDRNRWLRMKMVTAKTVEDFFGAAKRTAVNSPGIPVPNESKDAKPSGDPAPAYDNDFRHHLTESFSLASLSQMKAAIPADQKKWISDMIWTRAVILGNFAMADSVTDEVMKGRDTTRQLYERYKKASSPAEKKQIALIILANTPELVPDVYQTGKYLSYRSGYWACDSEEPTIDDMGSAVPAFLSKEQVEEASKEKNTLLRLPVRTTYLIPPVIEWAKNNKADPEAPKALHFLVASTRNECGIADDEGKKDSDAKVKSKNYSKEAFEFLHSQFPKSEWTAKTRYYY